MANTSRPRRAHGTPSDQHREVSDAIARLFMEVAPDAVIVSDAQGRLIMVNQQAEQLFGYPRAELLQLIIDDLLPERFRERHSPHRTSYMSAPRVRPMGMGLELFARRKDGSEFPVEISLSPVQVASSLHVVGIIRDITVRKQLEASLQAAQQEADHLKDEFIAIAAHELRNPLAALRGFTDMLQVQTARGHGPPLADWQVEAIEAIDQASLRLAELTDDLLDVTRLQADRLTLHLTSRDLVELTQRVVGRQQATTQRHTLTCTTTREPLMALVDTLRFEQILTNLLHNAIKYSPDGGHITVAITQDGPERACISITDHGIGIPQADQAQLFTRFARAANAHAIGGTGLGLYLCRALVELHGGAIGFTSEEGVGSTFWISLPLLVDEAQEAAATD